jgi:uncharacterized membrane protein YphA (DoxX/SURF4 family)
VAQALGSNRRQGESNVSMKAAFLIGRILFGGFFLQSGINHLKHQRQLGAYAGSKGIPKPEQAVLASGALLMLGGVSIMLGLKPKMGAVSLIAFLAMASGTVHDFWNDQDPGAKQNNLIHFSKNVALLGAALTLAGVEEWPASLG